MIQINNVTKSFGNVKVLDGVSLNIRKGVVQVSQHFFDV